MPSSNKTPAIGLNQWLGRDKPKKDDFNADNHLVDAAVAGLRDRMTALEEGAGSEAGEVLETLAAHAADGKIHVTPAEKEAWNAGGGGSEMVMGTYKGDGTTTRKIVMGFQPRVGFFFGVGVGATEADWTGEETRCYSAFFSVSGCSKFVTLNTDGITVSHTSSRPITGCCYKYNESNVTYVYVAWK